MKEPRLLHLLAGLAAWALGAGGLLGKQVWKGTKVSDDVLDEVERLKLTLVDVGQDTTLGDGNVAQELV